VEDTVLSHAEYRQFADACTKWARKAKSELERSQFLEMAEVWAKLAEKARTRRQATELQVGV
jgi:hypothetical protein